MTVCFSTRLGIILWSMVSEDWNVWWFDGFYFGVLELVPLILALVIIHWRVESPRDERTLVSGKPRGSLSAQRLLGDAPAHLYRHSGALPDVAAPWWRIPTFQQRQSDIQ